MVASLMNSTCRYVQFTTRPVLEIYISFNKYVFSMTYLMVKVDVKNVS